jgi:hypothetical protein
MGLVAVVLVAQAVAVVAAQLMELTGLVLAKAVLQTAVAAVAADKVEVHNTTVVAAVQVLSSSAT